jgi:RimJ/RimL family protein N-acetyltransferase
VSSENAASPENVPAPLSSHRPPVLETVRLRLRPWRDTDAPGPGQEPDEDSLRFMPAGAEPGPDDFPLWLARRRREMDTGADLHWCVADATSDAMLGNVQVFRMGPAHGRFQGELGYWLRPGARGCRIIGEALRPVLAYAFTPLQDGGLGLVRLHAATDSENHASQSILRSAGFTQWGADHQGWRRTDGSLSDGRYFELLASEPVAVAPVGGAVPCRDTSHCTPPTPARLDCERVVLRPWTDADLPRLVEALADWMSGSVDASTARKWLARRRPPRQDPQLVSWCIADGSTDEALGNIDVFDIARPLLPGGCELGYWTHPQARGRGYMKEALRRLLPHVLASTDSGGLGMRRVTARTSELNVASQSVMRAVGLRLWGSAPRASIAPDGRAISQLHFAVLADELYPVMGSGSDVEPATVHGKCVRLRPWRRADADRVQQACSDERTQRWLAHSLPSPYTLADAHSFIAGRSAEASQGGAVSWCVADVDSDLCLGSVAITDLSAARGTAGEVGYWAHPDARGRAVMSEAVRLAVRHAFIPREDGGLGRVRLQLVAADGNSASQHVALANGFVQVGRDRRAMLMGDGTFADLLRFDLLIDQWPSPSSQQPGSPAA